MSGVIDREPLQSVEGSRMDRWRLGLPGLLCGVMLLTGCARVLPRHQRLVSKPNMQFSDSLVFSYQDRLLSQIESGSTSFSGGHSAGCASCGAGGGR